MATYYFRNTGSATWDLGTNWSLTDGGGSAGAYPINTDDAYFTVNSGNCSPINNQACRDLICTGYTGTISVTNTLSIGRHCTLNSGMTLSLVGSSILSFVGTGTLTSNGVVIGGSSGITRVAGSVTLTFADNWTVQNWNFQSGAPVLNGSTINIKGNLTLLASTATGGGTTNLILNGTGTQTWSGNFTLTKNLTINKSSGNFTISGNVAFGGGKTLTYTTAGSTTTTGSSLAIPTSASLDISGMPLNTLNFNGTTTRTLLSAIYCNQLSVTGGASTTNGFNIYIATNLAYATTAATTGGGTTNYIMTGTGNWSHTTTGRFSNNLTIKSTAVITCTTNPVYISGGTFTVESGAVINSANITFASSCTINSNAVTLATCRFNSGTFTFNEDFNCTTFNANTTTTFTFTSATTKTINAANFSFAAGSTVNFKAGMTVNVSTALTLGATLQSTTSSSVFFNLLPGATQNVAGVAASWINSAGGQPIYNTGGTNTNTVNWFLTRPGGIIAFFMS